ncbi:MULTISPECIES: Fic family protein [unclassified Mesorhizobium]|uniref:Fic/DOC family protein n=1 Tax=unclassified Mesorhizobium TaxID=325217 RepID=UPI0032AFC021
MPLNMIAVLPRHDRSPQQAEYQRPGPTRCIRVGTFPDQGRRTYPRRPSGFRALQGVDHHLFQDVYEWAGEVRAIPIGKGGNWFCYPEYINQEMHRIFGELADGDYLCELDLDAFAVRAAHVLAEINAVHPFREGNGRTQLTFLAMLMENAGFPFNADMLGRENVLNAMIESFAGEETPLAELIKDIASQ